MCIPTLFVCVDIRGRRTHFNFDFLEVLSLSVVHSLFAKLLFFVAFLLRSRQGEVPLTCVVVRMWESPHSFRLKGIVGTRGLTSGRERAA